MSSHFLLLLSLRFYSSGKQFWYRSITSKGIVPFRLQYSEKLSLASLKPQSVKYNPLRPPFSFLSWICSSIRLRHSLYSSCKSPYWDSNSSKFFIRIIPPFFHRRFIRSSSYASSLYSVRMYAMYVSWQPYLSVSWEIYCIAPARSCNFQGTILWEIFKIRLNLFWKCSKITLCVGTFLCFPKGFCGCTRESLSFYPRLLALDECLSCFDATVLVITGIGFFLS